MINNVRFRLIHLSRCEGITRRWIQKVLKQDISLLHLYQMSPEQISHAYSLPFKNAADLYQNLHCDMLIKRTKSEMANHHIITILDKRFPSMLKAIHDPPLVLYGKGDLRLLNYMPSISVIGSRNPSAEAKKKVAFLIEPLIQNKWLIVSGMAKGVDQFAHEITLENCGKTIAVLGSGFHYIYPKENRQLFQDIVNKGLVLSEYPPTTRPARHHFPERNRIISGLSFGTLVIEAKKRSGTMITVDQALEQGREVFTVPGSIFMDQTEGCHQLIRDGAQLVTNASDILEEWDSIYKKDLFSRIKSL
ncbi:DNA processing protein DprA [Virgibacillus pantothenticus]|uniref:Smf/DprA SLOG domain-containing protein n=1 Tax=Virgibacillus pantothenticus TaxID=1473 RepID=A0A0L0QNQ0_VIRPA|nr:MULTISPECIES: DNA-processing protein DprA [Virgibacillus]API93875.1 DNA protecting protein DprA [Virgibacillus sp. 6R]KNE20159.1 hypothetical protein AFK71_17360 [Virgibacillus pantothenticus]MEB5452219.1 DNA-processing protein DprA [Virgibacillus pantothenticus]MEB5456216.1 DNA-processing protein DprA [Virgibacillus pantothenticus]MEB5460342.1 DNA-processing protein DprA [Virgibacillus pantothenticus]